MTDDTPAGRTYSTDEFGRPNDRDYHYRIPLNNDRAIRRAALALRSMPPYDGRMVFEWDEHSGDGLSYFGIRTDDSKGHLRGLEEFTHSPRWRDASSPLTEVDEYRQNPDGAGTMIRGTFRASPEPHTSIRIGFDAVVDLTPSEFEAALEGGETWRESVQPAIRWAKEEALEEYRERQAERRAECDHEHAVLDTGGVFDAAEAVGYCEDCGGELDENAEWVHA